MKKDIPRIKDNADSPGYLSVKFKEHVFDPLMKANKASEEVMKICESLIPGFLDKMSEDEIAKLKEALWEETCGRNLRKLQRSFQMNGPSKNTLRNNEKIL